MTPFALYQNVVHSRRPAMIRCYCYFFMILLLSMISDFSHWTGSYDSGEDESGATARIIAMPMVEAKKDVIQATKGVCVGRCANDVSTTSIQPCCNTACPKCLGGVPPPPDAMCTFACLGGNCNQACPCDKCDCCMTETDLVFITSTFTVLTPVIVPTTVTVNMTTFDISMFYAQCEMTFTVTDLLVFNVLSTTTVTLPTSTSTVTSTLTSTVVSTFTYATIASDVTNYITSTVTASLTNYVQVLAPGLTLSQPIQSAYLLDH